MADAAVLQRIRRDPKKAIDAARRGSITDLTELASLWHMVPGLLSLGILELFFEHLDERKVPPTTSSLSNAQTALGNLALHAILGVSKVTNDHIERYEDLIVKGWPGMFKWCSFLYNVRVKPATLSPQIRRIHMDVICSGLFGLSQESDRMREAIVSTPGSIELATQLWLLEDSIPFPSSGIRINSCALMALLKNSEPQTLDRTLQAAGGDAKLVAKLALNRMHKECQQTVIGDPAAICGDLLNQLSRHHLHPISNALLVENSITEVTKALLTTAKQLNAGQFLPINFMGSAFIYLCNCIEYTDGFSWVSQSIQAGLLLAFVECSPHYSKIEPEDCEAIFSIIKDILPKYLVYRSVLSDVNRALKQIEGSPMRAKIHKTAAKTIWKDFYALALNRLLALSQAKAWKGLGTICDNIKCLKSDSKTNFQKCAACGTTYYCSKDCQRIAWKEGGHKDVCKQKQTERLEGKSRQISKSDLAFHHTLAIWDARTNLSNLRSIAARDYPGIELSSLVIQIDYTVIPLKYVLRPMEEQHGLPIWGSDNAKARNETLLQRVKDNRDKYTLIESIVVHGKGHTQLVMTTVVSLWEKGGNRRANGHGGHDDHDDEDGPRSALEEVDDEMIHMSAEAVARRLGFEHSI